MARSGITDGDIYSFVRTAGAAQRAARYRQVAAKSRELAEAEKDGALQETLLAIAKEYNDLADSLVPLQQKKMNISLSNGSR